ncbi:MAG: peptidase MA family metallohydrolase, partial [Phycisphaerales bacterium]
GPTIEPEPKVRVGDSANELAHRLGAPDELGQITQALKEQLVAEYLSDEERAELRNAHGLWAPADLEHPRYAARAALDLGVYDHPSLSNPEADRLDRAQAALMRGEPQLAIDLIDSPIGELTIAELNLHAKSFEMLGQIDAAITTLEDIETRLETTTITDADTVAYAVEGLMQLTRLRGPRGDAKAEYQHLAQLLANARDHLDRLSWRVRLVEAELLIEHDNYQGAHEAAVEALRLHPRNAQAAGLIAGMAVDSFDFDTAEDMIAKLDLIAASVLEPDALTNKSLRNTNPITPAPPPTLESAIIRARIALRQRDAEGTERALDPMLARMPNQRDLLALNAAAAAAGFRMRTVDHLLDQFDHLSPGSPTAMMQVSKTLNENRQYAQASVYLEQTIERAPYWAKPRTDLGLLLVQSGDDDRAKDELESALKLNPFNVRAQNSLKLVSELASYSIIETDHFRIRYKPDTTDEILANEMPSVLERIHERVCSNRPGGVDFEPRVKTMIELMPNHEWFAVRIGGMPSIHTMAASTGPVIAIEAPKAGVKSSVGPYDWPRVLQHEYTHTVNLARTKNRVIHWMTEANAVFNEDSPRDARTWALLTDAFENDTLFDLNEINTAFVRPKKPSDRGLAYAQGAWMFEYIIERYGQEVPLAIFDASAAGRSSAQAFEQTIGVSPESFLTEFRSWAHDQLLERGLILPEGVPDLSELFYTNDTDDATPAAIPTIAQVDALLERFPDHPQLITLKVGIALVGADTRLSADQVELLELASKIRPTDESPHRRLAKHYLAGETLDERLKAIEHLEYLDAREIHSPAFASELALLYAQSDEPTKAIAKALRAVSISPYDADQREQAARVALLVGDLAQAKHQIEVLTKLEPDQNIHQRRLEAIGRQMRE